jgi:hypothetical protein
VFSPKICAANPLGSHDEGAFDTAVGRTNVGVGLGVRVAVGRGGRGVRVGLAVAVGLGTGVGVLTATIVGETCGGGGTGNVGANGAQALNKIDNANIRCVCLYRPPKLPSHPSVQVDYTITLK